MLNNISDDGWIVPKLLLAAYSLMIIGGVMGILHLLAI